MRCDKTITSGADSLLERERKRLELIESIYQMENDKNTPGGYCGQCKTHYKGNYTKHQCTP